MNSALAAPGCSVTFPLATMVTNRYSLDQAEEARIALEEGQVLGRAIIEI